MSLEETPPEEKLPTSQITLKTVDELKMSTTSNEEFLNALSAFFKSPYISEKEQQLLIQGVKNMPQKDFANKTLKIQSFKVLGWETKDAIKYMQDNTYKLEYSDAFNASFKKLNKTQKNKIQEKISLLKKIGDIKGSNLVGNQDTKSFSWGDITLFWKEEKEEEEDTIMLTNIKIDTSTYNTNRTI